MKKTAIIAAAIFAAGTTAQAQDVKHFDGGYAGASIGYTDGEMNADGFYYGAFAGWRKQEDNGLVWGFEGNFGKTSADLDAYGLSFDDVYDYEWTALATVGKVISGDKRSLVSLGAGFVQQKVTISYAGVSESGTGESYAIAAGYDRAISDKMFVRVRATTYEFDIYSGTVGLGFRF